MTNDKLYKLRQKINAVDDQLLDLLTERASVVSEIGKHKDISKTVVDLEREQTILNRLLQKTNNTYSKDTIIRIWREIFQASSKLQTNNNSPIQTKRSIENIEIYKGGKSNLKGADNIIKLSSNENSLGPSPNILKKINFKDISNRIHRYPQIDGIDIRNKLSLIHDIDPNRIVLGCGSDEVLLFAALSFCMDGDEIIHQEHGFEMYPIISKIVGATSKYAQEDKNYKVTVDSICSKITEGTKLIYLANPNNPTGTYLTKDEVIKLLKAIPKNIILVLDGAYSEYVLEKDFDKGFSLTDQFENIILTRTFSKAYGLAGLRIGWSYSSQKISSILNKVKGPFNTSLFSQEIAIAALDDQEYIEKIAKKNLEVKNWFEKELDKIKIKTLPSFGNFSFIETTDNQANKINNHLINDGIIVRQLHSYQLPNCLRITLGTQKEMETVINSLKKLQ